MLSAKDANSPDGTPSSSPKKIQPKNNELPFFRSRRNLGTAGKKRIETRRYPIQRGQMNPLVSLIMQARQAKKEKLYSLLFKDENNAWQLKSPISGLSNPPTDGMYAFVIVENTKNHTVEYRVVPNQDGTGAHLSTVNDPAITVNYAGTISFKDGEAICFTNRSGAFRCDSADAEQATLFSSVPFCPVETVASTTPRQTFS